MVSKYAQELKMLAAAGVGRGMEKALLGAHKGAWDQYSTLLPPLCYRTCFSNDEGKSLGG